MTTLRFTRWSKRQLERQIKAALFECAVLASGKGLTGSATSAAEALTVINEGDMLEFFDLPAAHAEADCTAADCSSSRTSNRTRLRLLFCRLRVSLAGGMLSNTCSEAARSCWI
jgi:hypothetical protein